MTFADYSCGISRYYGHSRSTWSPWLFYLNSSSLVRQAKLKVLPVITFSHSARIVLYTFSIGYVFQWLLEVNIEWVTKASKLIFIEISYFKNCHSFGIYVSLDHFYYKLFIIFRSTDMQWKATLTWLQLWQALFRPSCTATSSIYILQKVCLLVSSPYTIY